EEQFRANLLETRYRGGDLDGYCSRIHYFTEWVVDNEERGNVEDVTAEIGGERLNKRFNFMTENRERYPRLADNDELFECVREMESNLAEHTFHYVRQDDISSVYTELQAGDIVALVTDIEGLDVTHTGLVYDNGDGSKGLLHASTSGGVIVSPDLQRYVTNNPRQIGILVARPAGV
ncbi:MAG: N-acetylmuramoyl-L-alanine amidase-like domain-containing protein, partial [Bacteroidota bacterium]